MHLPDPFIVFGDHMAIDLPGGRAVFTTRRGGHSSGPYASLNLGHKTQDAPGNVVANQAALEALIATPVTRCAQVHGTDVVDAAVAPAGLPQADGQVTTTPGVAPMVLTADCLPVVLAGQGGVAVLHAGWRGLAGGILSRGVQALHRAGVRGQLVAAIGPGVGGCCYEVGEEVLAAFAPYGEDVRHGARIDLKAVAARILRNEGVGDVHDVGLCTMCSDPSLFFSHRRDSGVTGRQAGLAWLS